MCVEKILPLHSRTPSTSIHIHTVPSSPSTTIHMTSQDVRSILNLPAAGPSVPAPRKSAAAPRKPDGISRELYALIGDNAPSLAEAQASIAAVKYRDRPKLKAKKVKWWVHPPVRAAFTGCHAHIQGVDRVHADGAAG